MRKVLRKSNIKTPILCMGYTCENDTKYFGISSTMCLSLQYANSAFIYFITYSYIYTY